METKEVALVQPPATSTALTPLDMLKIAVEKGTDLAQLEKLLDMKDRWEANEARKAFVVALNAFKANPPDIFRDKQVSYLTTKGKTEYRHASLDLVSLAIGKALSEHGISHRWETHQEGAAIRVTCILTHELGHSERVTLQASADDSGGKNAIQAIGSTVTYLERYTLLAATGLATQDQDDDGKDASNGKTISLEQKNELIALIRETGTDTAKFLQFVGAESVDETPAVMFAEAKRMLEEKKRREGK